MRISRQKWSRKPGRRLDVSGLREALRDDRVWVKLGIVGSDGGDHYDLDDDDLLVEVRLMPDNELVTCRYGVAGGGPLAGVWTVPPIGAEVMVAMPDGEITFSPTIVGILSTGAVPDGVAPNVVVIAAPTEVLVHDGNGGAAELATKADIDALAAHIDQHQHAGLLGGTGSAAALVSTPTKNILGAPADSSPAAAGTTVLKGK